MKVEFLSDAINKPLGLMVIVLVGIFIIKMRGKIQTYGINNNRSFGVNNINIRNNGNNGNNRQGNNRQGNNGNNGRRRIGNIGRTALAIGDFYIAIQFGLFVFFLSLLIFILSAMEKASKETKSASTKVAPTKSTSKEDPPYFDFSEDQRRKGDLAFWSTGLLMGAVMTGAGKAKYFWPPWLVIAVQDFLRIAIIGRRMSAVGTSTQGENVLNVLFLIINIALMGAVVYYHSWSTLGKGGIIFLTSTFIAAMVAAVVMKIAEPTGTKKVYKKAIKQTPKKWVTVTRDPPPLNTPSGTSTRTWPSQDGKGGKA